MDWDITAVGELLIDFAARGVNAAGYPVMEANPGGAPANFLAAAASWGARAALIGKVGRDAFGDLLLSTLAGAGVDPSAVARDEGVFTTLAFVTLDERGERSFSFARKPGADTCLRPGEVDLERIRRSRALHFGTLSLTDEPARSATRSAVAWARELGKLVTFDPNLRPPLWRDEAQARAQMLWSLGQADVVKISGEEAAFLWGCGAEEAGRRLLGDFGVRLAMVTLGAQGCWLVNARAGVYLPCPPVKPVDTTGAGDIFGGTAAARLLELGRPPEELEAADLADLGALAVTAASLSTQYAGGIPSIRRRAEVIRALERCPLPAGDRVPGEPPVPAKP